MNKQNAELLQVQLDPGQEDCPQLHSIQERKKRPPIHLGGIITLGLDTSRQAWEKNTFLWYCR